MIKFTLPILSSWRSTALRWAAELRQKALLSDDNFRGWKLWPTEFAYLGGGTIGFTQSNKMEYLLLGDICFISFFAAIAHSTAISNVSLSLPFPGKVKTPAGSQSFSITTLDDPNYEESYGVIVDGESRLRLNELGLPASSDFTGSFTSFSANFFYRIN